MVFLQCTEEAHRPVDCATVSKWILKNSAESENMNWYSRHKVHYADSLVIPLSPIGTKIFFMTCTGNNSLLLSHAHPQIEQVLFQSKPHVQTTELCTIFDPACHCITDFGFFDYSEKVMLYIKVFNGPCI